MVTIGDFDNYIAAHVVKLKLEAAGIPCFLKDENTMTAWSGALGPIELLVPEADQVRAKALLRAEEEADEAARQEPGFWDKDTDQLDPKNRVCIHCGSKNTRRREDEKDTPFLSWLFARWTARLNSDRWHCFHCGADF